MRNLNRFESIGIALSILVLPHSILWLIFLATGNRNIPLYFMNILSLIQICCVVVYLIIVLRKKTARKDIAEGLLIVINGIFAFDVIAWATSKWMADAILMTVFIALMMTRWKRYTTSWRVIVGLTSGACALLMFVFIGEHYTSQARETKAAQSATPTHQIGAEPTRQTQPVDQQLLKECLQDCQRKYDMHGGPDPDIDHTNARTMCQINCMRRYGGQQ